MLAKTRVTAALERRRPLVLTTLVLVLAGSSLAVAEEGTLEPLEEEPAAPAPVEYREEDEIIVFSLPSDSGEYLDCSQAQPVGDEAADEDTGLTTDVDGCHAAPTAGPNGQRTHGQVVRAYVHAVKQLEYGGPRGQLVRGVAGSSLGKGAAVEDGEEALGSLGVGELSAASNGRGRGNGKGKGKDK